MIEDRGEADGRLNRLREPPVGFIGTGRMGLPMAAQLLQSGVRLVLWNRTPGQCESLRAAGAELAESAEAVFAAADVVILMLATAKAINEVLGRGTPAFARTLRGRTIIQMGTISPVDCKSLADDIAAAGGAFLECPVSGSPQQAMAGQLIGMAAGDPALFAAVHPLLSSMLHAVTFCGPVPAAMTMKLAVNLFLISTVTGLCEAFHFANSHGLDLHQFQTILDAGPMASRVSGHKLRKLLQPDNSVDATIDDVLKNNRLIAEAARRLNIASPLLDTCLALFEQTRQLGLGSRDMTAVLQAIAARGTVGRVCNPHLTLRPTADWSPGFEPVNSLDRSPSRF